MKAAKVVVARIITMAVALVCGFLTTNIVIRDAGVEVFALYSFLITIPALIPFTDLGAGAALVNRIAGSSDPDSDTEVRATILSISRIMIGFSAVLLALNAVLFLTGGWHIVLGSVGLIKNADAAAFVCVMIFGLSIPLSIGSRIYLGLEKVHFLVLFQGLQAPLTLFLVFAVTSLAPKGSGALLAVTAYAALFAVAAVSLVGASRILPGALHWAARRLAQLRRARGRRVMDIGLPLLIQTIAAPLAIQLDRVVLAQNVSAGELAMYGVAAQVFFALQSLFSTAGLTLWPTFARRMANGERVRPFSASALFAIAAAVCASIVCLVSGPFFGLLTNEQITVPWTTLLAFSAMLTVQAGLYPLGMFLMDKKGARFQTIPVLVMVTLNVSLSVLLARGIGVPGPILATVVATVVCQIVPYTFYIASRFRRLGR